MRTSIAVICRGLRVQTRRSSPQPQSGPGSRSIVGCAGEVRACPRTPLRIPAHDPICNCKHDERICCGKPAPQSPLSRPFSLAGEGSGVRVSTLAYPVGRKRPAAVNVAARQSHPGLKSQAQRRMSAEADSPGPVANIASRGRVSRPALRSVFFDDGRLDRRPDVARGSSPAPPVSPQTFDGRNPVSGLVPSNGYAGNGRGVALSPGGESRRGDAPRYVWVPSPPMWRGCLHPSSDSLQREEGIPRWPERP